MPKRIAALLGALPLLVCMAMLLLFPARYMASVTEGIALWATCVLPASLPFLFLSALLARGGAFRAFSKMAAGPAGKLFHVSGAGGCAAVLAALSGYPVGARTVPDLLQSGQIAPEEVFRLSCLVTTGGPVFLIGTVGSGMFGRPLLGAVLLLCHLVAVWTVCLFLRGKNVPERPPLFSPQKGNALFESVWSSVVSVLCVGASIALFHAFGQMVCDLLPLPPEAVPFLLGLTEMTAGCAALAVHPSAFALSGCAFFVTFGGACVLMQQLGFLSQAGVKPLPFLGVKLLQGVLAALLAYPLGLLLM